MTDIVNGILKIWPLLREDWRTVMLCFVLLCCAALLVWSGIQRRADRSQTLADLKTLQQSISELQETLDLVITIHNDRHPEDGKKFVRKLHHKQEGNSE